MDLVISSLVGFILGAASMAVAVVVYRRAEELPPALAAQLEARTCDQAGPDCAGPVAERGSRPGGSGRRVLVRQCDHHAATQPAEG